ncbi:MAG: phosphoribosylglycinamide formyltransferase [Synergistaceae bacterium]|jgi:phosphoribosylglycinamide formyltransferase-1|nr:phosphoribosylglycinamide formyltransferase [Synergistaceae bacterium]
MRDERVPLRLGVLVSGRGSNLQAILDMAAKNPGASVVVVVSDRPGAFALKRVEGLGIPGVVAERGIFRNTDDFEAAICEALEKYRVDLVVLAGFMRILSPGFVRRFPRRILNIHPALLPSFPGLHAQRQALEHGVKISGCTVHFVDETLDGGPIIAQAAVPVLSNDTEETLSARILREEHRLLPETILEFVKQSR